MIKTIVLLSTAVFLVAAHGTHDHSHDHDQEKKLPEKGIAYLQGKFLNSVVSGVLTFTKVSDKELHITGKITGMPAGHYGMNVHESADLSNGCANTKGHLNPHGHDHGHSGDEIRHVGDLGNIEFDENSVANVDITDHVATLWGIEGIIGRPIVLSSQKDDHGRTDHHLSKYDGNTGERVACGIIGVL